MASNVVNRKTVRTAVKTVLETELVGVGKPAQAIYGYQVADFSRQSPVIVVTSGGSRRGVLSSKELGDTAFEIIVHVFVLYAQDDGTWTESQSEDSLDDLEKEITDTLTDAFDSQNWLLLGVSGYSFLDPVIIGDEEYRHEAITLIIGVS